MNYTIKNEELSLTVSTIGAEIKSIIYLNKERIHDGNPKFWKRSSPLLFPCIGTVKDDAIIIDNKKYNMPKHGFLRDLNSTLIEKTPTSLSFLFKSSLKTLKKYPFKFSIVVKYEIDQNKVKGEIIINNKSNKFMPFNFGLHPAFKTDFNPDYSFEDYEIHFQSLKTYKSIIINQDGFIDFSLPGKEIDLDKIYPLKYDDYKNDAVVFDKIDFFHLTLQDKDKKHGVFFSFEHFPMLGIWTPNHEKAPFICIEPWMGCDDEVNSDNDFLKKKYLITLPRKKSSSFSFSMRFF